MMASSSDRRRRRVHVPRLFDDAHYRDFKRRNLARLLLTYLAPLILLTVFFVFQYTALVSDSQKLHLRAIAENQANTLELFLTERLVNLSNLIDDPKLQIPPDSETMSDNLRRLIQDSDAFVDLGFFDSLGIQSSYAGPYPSLEQRDYSSEDWYIALRKEGREAIITDTYLGFREEPHFTIAVNRIIDGHFVVLRATLSPRKIVEFLTALEGSNEVYASIVNETGDHQLVTEHFGTDSESPAVVPPLEPRLGVDEMESDGSSFTYAYSWLDIADWALIVQPAQTGAGNAASGFIYKLLAIVAVASVMILFIIFSRAEKLTQLQRDSDTAKMQLEHAAKLASVGELAAGIAHEINNPLAAINEEAGLAKDLLNPEFGEPTSPEKLIPYLDSIQQSVFRCRDITRKLLTFVRKSEPDFEMHDIHTLIDNIVKGILGPEAAVSDIEFVSNYGNNIPRILTDGNQLQQVLLNVINNARDAIEKKPGKVTVATRCDRKKVYISITDNGKGMTPDQLENIFVPFFTTKEVGKGTGLGLSVSYGIIKDLGGDIEVESIPGEGSTFTISLPKKTSGECDTK